MAGRRTSAPQGSFARDGAQAGRADKASSPDDVAYLALMGVLGPADNRAAMEHLALELPLSQLRGLGREAISRRMLVRAERLQRESVVRWQRRGRSANRPEARIRAATALLAAMLPELALGLAGLARLEPREALGLLRVPRLLGPARALQLLVDCCYPLALGQPDLAAEPGEGALVGVHWLRGGLCGAGWTRPVPSTRALRRCGRD